MVKRVLNISLVTKMVKYVCILLPKWAHIEEILMKLNICLSLLRDVELLKKYNEIWEKVSNSIEKRFNNEPV